MTKTIKKILIIGSAAFIIGIGGIAIAGMGMGYGSHMGGGYGYGHMNGYQGDHMGYGNGYGGHMMDRGSHHMYGTEGFSMNGGHMFARDDYGHAYGMTQDMYRYHNQAYGNDNNRDINQKNNDRK